MCVLTDACQQIIEPLFGEKRVLQATEVKFENASHRVDVMIILVIRQRVVSYKTSEEVNSRSLITVPNCNKHLVSITTKSFRDPFRDPSDNVPLI